MLTRKHYAPQSTDDDFETGIPDMCHGFSMITTVDEEVSSFVFPGTHRHVSYTAVEKRSLEKTLEMERVIISLFSIFHGHGHLQHARAGLEGSSR